MSTVQAFDIVKLESSVDAQAPAEAKQGSFGLLFKRLVLIGRAKAPRCFATRGCTREAGLG
jgi:hypothetical protein